MAVDSPYLSRQKIFAFEVETNTGTAVSLTNTSGGKLNAYDPKVNYDSKATQLRGQGALSRLQPVTGARSGKATFSSELFGSGTASTAPSWGTLLLACGFQLNTAVYTPLTGASTTMTMGVYQGGGATARLKTIVGAVGDLKLKGTYGQPMMLDWNFLGVYAAPTTVTAITPTFPTIIPPRFAGATITIGGTAYRIGDVEISIGNKLALRKDAAQATGYHSAYIVDRDITVKLSPEALPLTTQDWSAAYVSGTNFALSLTIGGTAGNEFTIAAPVMQLLNAPQDKDEEDMLHDDLMVSCVRNSAAGDDELTITCV